MSLELRNEYKRALGRSRERAFEALGFESGAWHVLSIDSGTVWQERHTQESTARGEQRLEKQKGLNDVRSLDSGLRNEKLLKLL